MTTQPADQFSELRSIQARLIHLADDLPKLPSEITREVLSKLRGDLRYLAERVDREASITPRYTGDGNRVLEGMIRNLADEMYGKFESLANSIDPDYIQALRSGDDID